MTVKLTIELSGPVGPDDKDILTGATMILMALTQKAVGEEEPDDKDPAEPGEPAEPEISEDETVKAFVAVLMAEPAVPEPCGKADDEGRICHGVVGHRGRHLFRKPAFDMGAMN